MARVDHLGDPNIQKLDPKAMSEHCRIIPALLRGDLAREEDCGYLLLSKGLNSQSSDQGGVDPTGKTDDDTRKPIFIKIVVDPNGNSTPDRLDLGLGLGPDSETITWQTTLAYYDLKLQTSLRFIDLFEFQGVAVNMRCTIGELPITGRFSFDSDLAFQSGNWSITAPFFGGSLTSAATFNANTLVSQNLTWSYWGDQLFVVITPRFDIVSFDGAMLEFAVPEIRVNLRWTLGCCDGPDLGDLGLVIRATKEKFESIAVTYTYSF